MGRGTWHRPGVSKVQDGQIHPRLAKRITQAQATGHGAASVPQCSWTPRVLVGFRRCCWCQHQVGGEQRGDEGGIRRTKPLFS